MITQKQISALVVLLISSLPTFAADIQNFHSLPSKGGKVFRGAAPGNNLHQLKENDISHVLIFKNEIKTEVKDEIKLLNGSGIKTKHIPFKWKDIDDSETACEQAIDALNYVIDTAKNKENGVMFHCTVGEDRTGLLAGIYLLATNKKNTIDGVYKNEMCKYGFANGNKHKPANVVAPILKELYPVYRMAAAAIEESRNKGEKPNKKYCRREAVVNIAPVRCP